MNLIPRRLAYAAAVLCLLAHDAAAQTRLLPPPQESHEKQGAQRKTGEEPAKVPVAELKFEGNSVFSPRELAEVMGRCLKGDGRPEAPLMYDSRLFEYCAGYDVVNYMRGKGYLQARVREPKKRESEEGLRITLPVEEGIRYRVGDVRLRGVTIFTHDHVMQTLRVAPGDVASGTELLQGLQHRLNAAYGERGHIMYDYDIEPTFNAAADGAGEGTVDFDIRIEEGPTFRVRRIEFYGNATTRDDVLRRELSVKAGETFSPSLLDDSIRRLNALGLFAEIDSGRNVDYVTFEDEGLLDLRIRVVEVKPR